MRPPNRSRRLTSWRNRPSDRSVGIVGTVIDIWAEPGTYSSQCPSVSNKMPVVIRNASGDVLGRTRTSRLTPFACQAAFGVEVLRATVYEIQVGEPGSVAWYTTTQTFTFAEVRDMSFRVELYAGGD